MTGFAFGVATVIMATAYGAHNLLKRHRPKMQAISRLAQPLMGAIFILVGTTLYFKLHHPLEAWVLDTLPD
jgi:cytochrome c biogenesis protein CcdA